ncbi:TnsA-like heteromeric transposase endonuclease subunit [bacterium RCC_150]
MRALETALPVRRFHSWHGKRNYEGLWWSSTNRAHIPFESLLERQALLAFDFDPAVRAIAAQPLAFLWPAGVTGQRNHVPDFFLRLASGDGLLVDVRADSLIDEHANKQHEMCRLACDEVGWKYQVFKGIPKTRLDGLRWLAGFRYDRYAPEERVIQELLSSFRTPTPLGRGVDAAMEKTGLPRGLVLANTFHLLWTGTLTLNLDTRLSMNSEVSA